MVSLRSICSKQIIVIILTIIFIASCGSGESNNIDVATNNDQLETGVEPSVVLSATPTVINSGETSLLNWSAQGVTTCILSGNWSGSVGTNGTQSVGPLIADSEFFINCSGENGNVSASVKIMVTTNGENDIVGIVDSSLIARDGLNKVYVFEGSVIPDDIDGIGVEPITTISVNQESGTCVWSYKISGLKAGNYTLAFTSQGEDDLPESDDQLNFVGPANVTINDTTIIKDFLPSNVIRVGPGRAYASPRLAAAVANDGDVVEIDAGLYLDDIAVWRQNNLTLRGVAGRAPLKATKPILYTKGSDQENGMGIWVTKGDNIVIENIEFSGATVPDENGAGIRAQGGNLTICNSHFHDNENGILGAGRHILIEYSEFEHNGLGEIGKTHNIYIDGGEKFTFRYSYSHHAHIGHNLKSRAKENHILYSRIMDEIDGDSSYAIDVPNGGLTYIIGNLIQQGPLTDNSIIVAYGAEGLSNPSNEFYFINNSVVNDRGAGTFLDVNQGTTAKIYNNIFSGGGTMLSDPGDQASNLETTNPGFVDIDSYDYHLLAGSPAIDNGFNPGISLIPTHQYIHPINTEPRPINNTIDIGAYEY